MTLETAEGSKPLLIAGGAGYGTPKDFASGQHTQTGSASNIPGSSGVQTFSNNGQSNFYCAGAGFVSGPEVRHLEKRSKAPSSYENGLVGGKGIDSLGAVMEGGFGGGGATFYSNSSYFFGAGGGYTGGGTRFNSGSSYWGGGGGSFSCVEDAVFGHNDKVYGTCKLELLTNSLN